MGQAAGELGRAQVGELVDAEFGVVAFFPGIFVQSEDQILDSEGTSSLTPAPCSMSSQSCSSGTSSQCHPYSFSCTSQ